MKFKLPLNQPLGILVPVRDNDNNIIATVFITTEKRIFYHCFKCSKREEIKESKLERGILKIDYKHKCVGVEVTHIDVVEHFIVGE